MFLKQAYIASMPKEKLYKLLATHIQLGTQADTEDSLLVSQKDRQSGTYLLGVQSVGKTRLIENMAQAEIMMDEAIIVIDPHGDLTNRCIAQMPEKKTYKTYLLDMEDTEYPIGINIFGDLQKISGSKLKKPLSTAWAVDRVMHIFDRVFPEIMTQAHLPRFLRAATIALFANPGTNLTDMLDFLIDDQVRQKLLKNVTDKTVLQFWSYFDAMSPSSRRQQIDPLVGRLESLFMGRSVIRNIISQPSSINFREAIENKEIIFIKLPIMTNRQDAQLIGTLLLAQIHAAIFSFADLPEAKRPGFSLYVDEFQHFATEDFSEMFTGGRKFGVRVTVAHQYRRQLPEFLQAATLTARTKICMQTTPPDAREVAHLFLNGEMTLKPEDIDPRPVEHLLKFGSGNVVVQTLTDFYIRGIKSTERGGKVDIKKPGFRWDHAAFYLLCVPPPEDSIKVPDPLPYLNHLLYEVMKTGDKDLPIREELVYGFSNCGRGFYSEVRRGGRLLKDALAYPFGRIPADSREQLWHFLFCLKVTMSYLAENPIGKRSTLSSSEVAQMLTQLPRRAAFVRSGEDVGVIYTDDSMPCISNSELKKRLYFIRELTRMKYSQGAVSEITEPMPAVKKPQVSRWEEVK